MKKRNLLAACLLCAAVGSLVVGCRTAYTDPPKGNQTAAADGDEKFNGSEYDGVWSESDDSYGSRLVCANGEFSLVYYDTDGESVDVSKYMSGHYDTDGSVSIERFAIIPEHTYTGKTLDDCYSEEQILKDFPEELDVAEEGVFRVLSDPDDGLYLLFQSVEGTLVLDYDDALSKQKLKEVK